MLYAMRNAIEIRVLQDEVNMYARSGMPSSKVFLIPLGWVL